MSATSHPSARTGSKRSALVLLALVAAAVGGWLALARIDAAPVVSAEHDAHVEAASDRSAAEIADEPVAAPASDAVDLDALARASRRSSAPTAENTKRWTGGILTGRVLGGPGAVEPMAGVEVLAAAPTAPVFHPVQRTRTDAQGRFTMRDLPAARWELEARIAAENLRASASVELDERERPTAEIALLLPYERRVTVRLVDPRGRSLTAESLGIEPIYLPLVCVGLGTTCKEIGSVLNPADAPLSRVADKNPPGERSAFEVVIRSAGAECLHALFGDRVIASRALPRDARSVELVVAREALQGLLAPCTVQLVASNDSAPLAGGTVRFQVFGASVARDLGERGLASVAGIPVGTVRVTAESRGYVTRRVDVELPSETVLRIEMKPARRITGRVAIEGGRDPAGTTPGVWRVTDGAAQLREPTMVVKALTVGIPRFQVDQLEPGIYVVAAVPGSVALHSADDVRAGRAQGAAWIDLSEAASASADLVVPLWLAEPGVAVMGSPATR